MADRGFNVHWIQSSMSHIVATIRAVTPRDIPQMKAASGHPALRDVTKKLTPNMSAASIQPITFVVFISPFLVAEYLSI